ncbi:MAG: hypothetical protein J6Y02_11785 [Pseudobutyrivibrio sp.]|nr:hypothetical protein [Lachnospiraceae bacterium]MBP5596055.1 hypothetical protein [Pseudobutyrivibrio sp.]
MDKSNWKDLWNSVKTGISDHAPAILIGLGAASFIGMTILAVKETPKALEHIEAKKKELGKDKLTFKETVQACGKDYIPAIVTGVVATGASVGAAICAEREHKVAAGALSALAMSEKTIDELRDAAKDVVGKTKASEIEEKVAERHIKEDIQAGKYDGYTLDPGQIWFRDRFTGQSFISTYEKLDHAKRAAREIANSRNGVSIVEWYDELQQIADIHHMLVTPGMDNMGWWWNIQFDFTCRPINVWDNEGNIKYTANEIWYDYAPVTLERAEDAR